MKTIACPTCSKGATCPSEHEPVNERADFKTITLSAQASAAAKVEIERILIAEQFDEIAESDVSDDANREKVRIAHLVQNILVDAFPHVKALIKLLRQPNSPAAIVVRGLPASDRAHLALSSAVSLAMGLMAGEVYQFQQQNSARMVARLQPVAGAANNSGNSDKEFLSHTDDALIARRFRTEWIGLFGVVNQYGAATGFAPVAPAWCDLVAEQLAMLRVLLSDRFIFGAPTSFGIGESWSIPRPILWKNENGDPCITLPTYNTRPADPNDQEARDAIDIVQNYLGRYSRMIVVGPGDWMLFANDRGLHNRQKIIGDRLVLRTYVRRNLDDLRCQTDSRGYVFDLNPIVAASTLC